MKFPCLNPRPAVNLFTNSDGKMKIKFLPFTRHFSIEELVEKYGSDNVFLFPCGECEHCRRNYADEWAIRCTLEAKEHPFNYFITLTYDDRHIQYGCIEDLRKFLDRLSGRKHKNKFKFFACMERGEETQRLHFHLVLFSDFELDLKEPQWISGFYYYHSSKIEDLWTFGWHNVAPFESTCARYVAKYTSKNKSRIIMSRNLGRTYYDKYYLQIASDGFRLYGNFGSSTCVPIPSCMIKWFVEDEHPFIDDYINERKEFGKLISAYNFRNLSAQYKGDDIRNFRAHVFSKGKGGI